MRPCSSTFVGIDGQLAACVKSEGHGGTHFSIDGELWEDAEQAPVRDRLERDEASRPEGTTPLNGLG